MCVLKGVFIWQPAAGAGEEDDDNEPLDLSWPKTCRKRLTYILVAPILFPLYITLPDPRRPVGIGARN